MRSSAIVAATLLIPAVSYAGEDAACAIGCGTVSPNSTHSQCRMPDGGTYECAPDAGGACNWDTNDTVIVQCDKDVYLNSTNGKRASSLDFEWRFSVDSAPIIIHLYSKDRSISCLAKKAHSTCKFGKSNQPKPWKNNP